MNAKGGNVIASIQEGLCDLFNPPATNLPALDVLRSAAILLVFTGHYVGEYHAKATVQNFPVFRWGWTGVDLFFVLSGLLIGSQLWKELDRTGRIRIGHFLLRRGLRIWPLYSAFVTFIIFLHFFGKDLTGIWSDFIFFTNFIQGQVSGGWSLSTEEQFYIVTPLLLSILALQISPRRLGFLPFLAIGALVCARAWVSSHSMLPEADLRQRLYHPSLTHADGLAVGVFWHGTAYCTRSGCALCGFLGVLSCRCCALAYSYIAQILSFGTLRRSA